jgi:hypothetical protein
MRIFLAFVMVVLMAGSAFAQNAVPRYGEIDKEKSPHQKEEERQAERAYKRSLNAIPDKSPTDPWGTVRNDSAPKASASPAPKKTQSSGTAKNQ